MYVCIYVCIYLFIHPYIFILTGSMRFLGQIQVFNYSESIFGFPYDLIPLGETQWGQMLPTYRKLELQKRNSEIFNSGVYVGLLIHFPVFPSRGGRERERERRGEAEGKGGLERWGKREWEWGDGEQVLYKCKQTHWEEEVKWRSWCLFFFRM